MGGDPALGSRGHEIAEPDVGKRSSRHHPVIAPATAVAVEVSWGDAAVLQEQAGRRIGIDGTGRGNVVGGDAVVDTDKNAGARDRPDRRWLRRHLDEKRRFLHVGALFIPVENIPLGSGDGLPLRRPIGGRAVLFDVHFR